MVRGTPEWEVEVGSQDSDTVRLGTLIQSCWLDPSVQGELPWGLTQPPFSDILGLCVSLSWSIFSLKTVQGVDFDPTTGRQWKGCSVGRGPRRVSDAGRDLVLALVCVGAAARLGSPCSL